MKEEMTGGLARFGRALRVMRALRNVSQMELQKQSGIYFSTISDIERGLVSPSKNVREALRSALCWGEREDQGLTILDPEEDGQHGE